MKAAMRRSMDWAARGFVGLVVVGMGVMGLWALNESPRWFYFYGACVQIRQSVPVTLLEELRMRQDCARLASESIDALNRAVRK